MGLVVLASVSGCFTSDDPLPPEEALRAAARRIDALLVQEDSAGPAVSVPARAPGAGESRVRFWYPAHPLVGGVLLSEPAVLSDWAAAHPGVTLEPQFIGPWEVAVQKLTVALATGDTPDIALVERPWLGRLVEAGAVAPLDPLLPSALLEDLRPPAREAGTSGGRLYALPADGFCSVLLCNGSAIATPPETWDRLQQAARAANRPEAGVYALGYVPFVETLWSAGGGVGGPGERRLDGPEALAALEFLLGLRAEGLAHPRACLSADAGFDLFRRGTVLMTVASSERLAETRHAAFPVLCGPVPGKSGPISRLSGTALVVFAKRAAGDDAIAQALEFLVGACFQTAAPVASGSAATRVTLVGQAAVSAGVDAAFLRGRAAPLIGPWPALEAEADRCVFRAYRWQENQLRGARAQPKPADAE